VVCGNFPDAAASCPGVDPEIVAMDDELHEVRCCADEYIPGFKQNARCPNGVWGSSEIDGQCYNDKNYNQAAAICDAAGATGRLCTRIELHNFCGGSSGCGHNSDLLWSGTVWSSTPDSPTESPTDAPSVSPTDPPSHWVVCGNYPEASRACSGEDPEKVALDDELHEVRCCSDQFISGFEQKNRCPNGVWGGSKIGGQCYDDKTYQEAFDICDGAGVTGRLCTRTEIHNFCAGSTGCGFNAELVWTSTDLSTGGFVAPGNSTNNLIGPVNSNVPTISTESPTYSPTSSPAT